MMHDSEPAPFDSSPHRRSGERRLEAIANNALLKVLQYAITGIALPMIGMGINAVLTRMDNLERQFQAQDKIAATVELRLLQVEKTAAELSASSQAIRERMLALEYQMRTPSTLKGTGP